MSLPPPPNYGIWSIAFQDAAGGVAQFNTWGFGNFSLASAAACNNGMRAAMIGTNGLYKPALYSLDYFMVETYCLINIGGTLTSDQQLFGVAGSGPTTTVPPATSLVLQKKTSLAGRQFRGRVAIPSCFIDETKVTSGGVFQNPNLTNLQAAATVSLGAANAGGFPLVLLHGPNKMGVTPLPTNITSLNLDAVVGTQRKRQAR